MAKDKTIIEPEALFVDEKVFGDRQEHCYECECHDGYAIATRDGDKDERHPTTLHVTYPTRGEVMKDKALAREIMNYRGLYDQPLKNLHYGDIMMYLGKIDIAVVS